MSARWSLFHLKEIYNHEAANDLFLNAVRENVEWHFRHCTEYREMMERYGFYPEMLADESDLAKLPPLPTLLLKSRQMLSIPSGKLLFSSTTSGTSGNPVEVGFDKEALLLGFPMVLRMLMHHRVCSLKPVNYLILGYEPHASNRMGAARTANVATYLAPAKERTYALVHRGNGYTFDIEGVKKALLRYAEAKHPIRILGFPSYFYFLLKQMEEQNIRVCVPKDSMVLLGGGWKQFDAFAVDKQELYRLADTYLGITSDRFHEFFGVVEHNVPYFDCSHHHFHVPIYSKVIIRDCHSMEDIGYGKPGLLNLITPLLKSMPLTSVMTDDIAILYEGGTCGCGNPAPYFEILGRSSMQGIVTCTANAQDILEGLK